MTIFDLIKGKSKKTQGATAIHAISAIEPKDSSKTVAKIAPIAIANTVIRENSETTFTIEDDRRCCTQCNNLTSSGLCVAARRGEIMANRSYHPCEHIPRRCESYLPKGDEIDQRTGKERWPWLIHK